MQQSRAHAVPIRSPWQYGLIVSLIYFAAAYGSLALTQGSGDIAAIWPASGVALTALLLAGPQRRYGALGGIGLASLAANMLAGTPVMTSAAFTFANLLEVTVISGLMILVSPKWNQFHTLRTNIVFLTAIVVGGLASASTATLLAGASSIAFFVSWFTTVVLGALIVTPLLLTIIFRLNAKTVMPSAFRIAQFGALLGLIIAGSFAIFQLDAYYMLFIPLLGVVVATYAFGPTGAALGISAIAFTMAVGVDVPTGSPHVLGLNLQVLGLQFYLLCLLGAAWPLTALLIEKERLIRRYCETNEWLELAERTAHVGHWFAGTVTDAPIWSDEVYRIHGLEHDPKSRTGLKDIAESNSLQLYHRDDRERVRGILLEAMQDETPFEYKARIVRPDGSIRHVHSVGRPHYNRRGEYDGLFGTFHDVTDQTEVLEKLNAAKSEALREAAEAKRLSETDDLTGISNRRRIMALLDDAASIAAQGQTPLCIGIVDIDHFKSVNDRFGHAVGDTVLIRVAEVIQIVFGEKCHVGRLGGEEFLIVLPNIDDQAGIALLQLLCARIACEPWADDGPETITVSVGLAQLGSDGDVSAALKAADNALYEAKNSGRNAVRHAGTAKQGDALCSPDHEVVNEVA